MVGGDLGWDRIRTDLVVMVTKATTAPNIYQGILIPINLLETNMYSREMQSALIVPNRRMNIKQKQWSQVRLDEILEEPYCITWC